MAARKIGIFGGTFDPLHMGHVIAASEVCSALNLDEVCFVPTATQPFKTGQPGTPGAVRLQMCAAVAELDARFSVSDVDVARGGTTYTVDTLTDLRERYPDAVFYFITGADALARFEEWKAPEILLTLATFVGINRPGYELPQLDSDFVLVQIPGIAISSTEVRHRVSIGAPIRYLVPDSVAAIINEHGLYRGGEK